MLWGWYYEEELTPPDNPRYCPQNIAGFYTINFNAGFSFDATNYCPQTITGFYTISFNQNIGGDTTRYCPQNTTGFYTFSQAP